MASNSNRTADAATAELFSVNELREKHKTSWAVFAGACAQAGWRPGRMVTSAEYEAAVADFLGASTDRR